MGTERQGGGVLRFHHDEFAPAGPVVKAAQRVQWRALDALRREADERIVREIAAATAAAEAEVKRRADEHAAHALQSLIAAFDAAALRVEQQALELALAIARRIVDEAAPGAFFARAAEHLKAIVPPGEAIRVRVHPQALRDFAPTADALSSQGARHVDVIGDERLPGPRSLVVETRDGEIDLGCDTQWRRLAASLESPGAGPGAGGAS